MAEVVAVEHERFEDQILFLALSFSGSFEMSVLDLIQALSTSCADNFCSSLSFFLPFSYPSPEMLEYSASDRIAIKMIFGSRKLITNHKGICLSLFH